jgi:TRAP-type C4-dicarboxylate transport system substrate-binding protein
MAETVPKTIRRIIEVETDPDQAYFWTEEWQEREREASRQIEDGEGTIFASPEEFLRALDPARACRDGI